MLNYSVWIWVYNRKIGVKQMNHARLNKLKAQREEYKDKPVQLRGIEASLRIFYILNGLENTQEAKEVGL